MSEIEELKEQVQRLTEVVDRLEKFISPRVLPEAPFEAVEASIQERGEQAVRDLMIWTAMSLRELENFSGIDRRSLSNVLKGKGRKKSIRKVLVFRKKYAEQTGRTIEE